jgi:hypothetical protein
MSDDTKKVEDGSIDKGGGESPVTNQQPKLFTDRAIEAVVEFVDNDMQFEFLPKELPLEEDNHLLQTFRSIRGEHLTAEILERDCILVGSD